MSKKLFISRMGICVFGINICGEICASDMPSSCLCFAEVSIYFCFGEFRANSYVLFLGKVMPKFYMTLKHACILFITLLLVIPCSRS